MLVAALIVYQFAQCIRNINEMLFDAMANIKYVFNWWFNQPQTKAMFQEKERKKITEFLLESWYTLYSIPLYLQDFGREDQA